MTKHLTLMLSATLLLAAGGQAAANCAPEKLVRIETQNNSPGYPADSFARKSKITYRLGNGRMRQEEQHDVEENVQLLFIFDAPRAWQIDLVSKTGETGVDDEVPPKLVASVFSEDELPEEIRAVEFGCEREFITDARTTHEPYKDGVAVKHSIRSGKWKFTIFTRAGSDIPMAAILSENDKAIGAIKYVSYQTLDAVPEELFTPPADIEFKSVFSGK